jgi:Protein of unknown function (DUF754).
MPKIELIVQVVTALAYLLSALRLASYRRGAARYRRCISLLASLFGATLCIGGLEILLYRQPTSLWQAMFMVLLCILIFRSRGNVAALLRPSA